MKSKPAIFAEFPDLAEHIPSVELASLPTPIDHQLIEGSSTDEVYNLWVKRDDKTNAVYGGNKVRKLEFIIAELQSKGIRKLVTFGGLGTNHGVATSYFCQQFGIACEVLLFAQPVNGGVLDNLKLMTSFGAKLTYSGSLLNTALKFYMRKFISSSDTYFLHAGGSNISGCIAFVSAVFELKAQIERGELSEPDYIFCPVGSSGTVAGLSLGCQLAGLHSKVVGIRVAPSHLGPIPICTPDTAFKLKTQTYSYLRKLDTTVPNLKLNKIHLVDSYYGRGYGFPLEETEEVMDCFKNIGVRLDTTYTAKAAAAALDFCRKHPEKKVLYWHTFNSSDISNITSGVSVEDLPGDIKKIIDELTDK